MPESKLSPDTRRLYNSVSGITIAFLLASCLPAPTRQQDFYPSGESIPVAAGTPGPTPRVTPWPTLVPVQDLLVRTRVAVQSKKETTSFVERAPWTKEIFNSIRQSILVFESEIDRSGVFIRGTGVVLNNSDEKSQYLLTTDHGYLHRTPGRIQLFRPGVRK